MFLDSIVPFLISFICFPILIYHKKISNATGLLDYPNKRKRHSRTIPKIGGIYILSTSLLAIIYYSSFYNERLIFSYIILITGLFVIGLVDDKIEIKGTSRLFLQFIIIAISISIDFNLNVEILKLGFLFKEFKIFNGSILFTIFCIIALVNATNLVDGKDGLTGFIFLLFIIVFLFFINNNFNYILIVLFISTCLFLTYNINGKIFLGNAGSYLIGGIMSFITIQSYNYKMFEVEIIFCVFYLFGLDMLRVYLERLFRGIHPFTAENNHLHHYIFLYFKSKYFALFIYLIIASIPFFIQIFYKNYILILVMCFSIYLLSFLYFRKKNNLLE